MGFHLTSKKFFWLSPGDENAMGASYFKCVSSNEKECVLHEGNFQYENSQKMHVGF